MTGQAAERGGDVNAATDRLSGYEKEFQNELETTRTDIAAKAPGRSCGFVQHRLHGGLRR